MNISLQHFHDPITYKRTLGNIQGFFSFSSASLHDQSWSSCPLNSLLQLSLLVSPYVDEEDYENQTLVCEIWICKYFSDRLSAQCNRQNLDGVFISSRTRRSSDVEFVSTSKCYTVDSKCSRLLKSSQDFSNLRKISNCLYTKRTELKSYICIQHHVRVIAGIFLRSLNDKYSIVSWTFATNNCFDQLENGVMQKSSNHPLAIPSSALNTDFAEKNIFENFFSFIGDLNFPSCGGEFLAPQMTDSCLFSERDQKIFKNVAEEKCSDMHMNENKEKIESKSLVSLENSKRKSWADTRVPCKNDKTFLPPLPPPSKETAVKNEHRDEATNHDYENENFTSVFTKSLTSLYSHDSETAYTNELNMKCVVGDVNARLDEGEFSSDSIDSKSGTNKLRSDSISDQSFDSAFHIVEKPSVDSSLKTLQPEHCNMFSSDSDSGCDGKKAREELNTKASALTCFRYEPFELPSAISTKQDVESEFSLGSNNQESTFISIGENSNSFPQEKPVGFNMPNFQWKRSNFSSGLRQSSVRGRLDSRNQVCNTRRLLLFNQKKGHGVYNKNLRSVRGRRPRTVRDENSLKSSPEKPYMKISALSVYATVQEAVVLSVKCKRYKRRSEKYYNKSGEKILSDQNSEPSLENPGVSCNSEEKLSDPDHEIKEITTETNADVQDSLSDVQENPPDIQRLATEEIRELVTKLCVDYCLDQRDFDDLEQIKAVRVIDDIDEAQVRRGRPRRTPPADQEESESESSSVETSQSSVKEDTNIKVSTASHRILRSLPCRRSPRTLKNGAKSIFTHRYCTRNAENQLSADDSVIYELSESEKPIVLLERQDMLVLNNDDSSTVTTMKDNWPSCSEYLYEDKPGTNKKVRGLESDLRSESCNSSEDNEPPKLEIKTENKNDTSEEYIGKEKDNLIVSTNPSSGCLKIKIKQQKISEYVPCQEMAPKEPYLKEHELTEPPGLVKVENEEPFFSIEKENEESISENNVHDERLSPRYLVADNILPRPDDISDQKSNQINYPMESSNAFCLQEDNSCMIPSVNQDMEDNKEAVQSMLGNHDSIGSNISGKDLPTEEPLFLKTPKLEPPPSPMDQECIVNTQENFDDDCIVISVDDDDDESSQQPLPDALAIAPKREFPDQHSNESDLSSITPTEGMLTEGMDLRLLKDLSPRRDIVSKSSFLHKDERDESILRNLLLDSTDNISNVPPSTASSQDHSSPTPIITSVISLNGIKSISPSPPPSAHQDTLKRPSSVDSCSPFLSRTKYIKTIDMLPSQGHQDRENSRDISHAHFASPNRDDKCDLRRLLSNENLSPSYSPKPPAIDNRDQPCAKDSHQLKDNIKKLKNEIVYLQMMAEQKEKEKIAIVCFKRYKEEILKRMYKAYAYSLRNRLNEFLRPEDCPNDAREATNQPNLHSVQSNTVPQPASKYSEPVPSGHQRSLYPSHCLDANFQDPKVKLSPRHQRFTAPGDYSSGGAQRANYKLQISALESRRLPAYNDKLPAVESMVASASDNYGFDMRNVKESTEDRKSRLKASLANTILQKALASREALGASITESTGNSNSSLRAYQLNRSNNFASSHLNVSNNTSAAIPKRYPCESIPLDMAMPRGVLGKTALNKISTDVSSPYNGASDSSHQIHQMNTRGPKEACSIQALLKESRGRSGNIIPSSLWAIPNGDNIAQNQKHEIRKDEVKIETSALRRQVEPATPMVRHNSAVMSRGHSENGHLAGPPAISSKGILPVSHPRGISSAKDGATLNGVVDRLYSRKLEEGRMKGYITSPLSNSTVPYGGRLVKSERAAKTASNIAAVGNSFGSGTQNSPRCMGCGLSDAKFLCSGCRKDWYCSPQCQSLRWPEHSQTCAGRIYGQVPGTFS